MVVTEIVGFRQPLVSEQEHIIKVRPQPAPSCMHAAAVQAAAGNGCLSKSGHTHCCTPYCRRCASSQAGSYMESLSEVGSPKKGQAAPEAALEAEAEA